MNKNIGETLKKYRKKLSLSLENVCDLVDINCNDVKKIENGEKTVLFSELDKFAKAYKMNIEDISEGKYSKNNYSFFF